MSEYIIQIIIGMLIASTPLIFAAIGELVVERSGVLNLGIEGMMIIGAISAFSVLHYTNSYILAVIAAIICGSFMALIFGIFTQILLTNQVATGLALTLFCLGLAALWGQSYSGISLQKMPDISIIFLSNIAFIGPLFQLDALIYIGIIMVAATSYFLFKTKTGLVIRAIGDNHDAAYSLGYKVVRIRLYCIMFGGAMAGIGGSYLTLVQTPLWLDNMTAGRGWIALALVVFASWMPSKILLGALLFGGITILQLHAQGFNITINAQYMAMLPYITTIIVLVYLSYRIKKQHGYKNIGPKSLGKTFHSTI